MAMCEQPALRQDNGPLVPFKKKHSFSRCLAHIIHLEAVQVIGLFQEACTKVSGRRNGYKILTDAVNSMHTASQRTEIWYKLCEKYSKSPRLLPREVITRWGSFNQLLIVAVEYRNVLDEFVETDYSVFPDGFWDFCALISKYVTKPLRDITEVAINDSSSNSMTVSLLYYAISRLEDGLLKISAKFARAVNDGDPISSYLHAYCHLAVNKLGLKLRSYFNYYKQSPMEKFKFLFIPYNIWFYGHKASSRFREILGWGEIAKLESFMLETLSDREALNEKAPNLNVQTSTVHLE